MNNKDSYIIYSHSDSSINTIGDLIGNPMNQISVCYSWDLQELLNYTDENDEKNIIKIINRYSSTKEKEIYIDLILNVEDKIHFNDNIENYKKLPLKINTSLCIPKNKINIEIYSTLSNQIEPGIQSNVFLAKNINDLLKDSNYQPVLKNLKNNQLGSLKVDYPNCTVWIWCRSLFNDKNNEIDELKGTIFNLTPFIINLNTNTTNQIGTFSFELNNLICYYKEKDGWQIKNLVETDGNFISKFSLDVIDNNELIRNKFFFNTIISENDIVFLRFETLKNEINIKDIKKVGNIFYVKNKLKLNKETIISNMDLPNNNYDMIGLVDSCSSNIINNNITTSIQGRDLRKLIIEDGCYFYPIEFIPGGIFSNEIEEQYLDRIDGKIINITQTAVKTISYTLKFIINNLARIKICSEDLFKYYGKDRISKTFRLDIESRKEKNKKQIEINDFKIEILNLIHQSRKDDNLKENLYTDNITFDKVKNFLLDKESVLKTNPDFSWGDSNLLPKELDNNLYPEKYITLKIPYKSIPGSANNSLLNTSDDEYNSLLKLYTIINGLLDNKAYYENSNYCNNQDNSADFENFTYYLKTNKINSPSKVINKDKSITETNPAEGTITTTFPDGKQEITQANGSKMTIYPNGAVGDNGYKWLWNQLTQIFGADPLASGIVYYVVEWKEVPFNQIKSALSVGAIISWDLMNGSLVFKNPNWRIKGDPYKLLDSNGNIDYAKCDDLMIRLSYLALEANTNASLTINKVQDLFNSFYEPLRKIVGDKKINLNTTKYERIDKRYEDLTDKEKQIIKLIWNFILREKVFKDFVEIYNEKELAGIWKIIKFVVDDKEEEEGTITGANIGNRRICDSSIGNENGSLASAIQKICQDPFVEFFGDTYGDQYYFIARQPPFTENAYKDLLNKCSIIEINEGDVISEELQFNTDNTYSWYKLRCQNSIADLGDGAEIAYLKAVHFKEYSDIWGEKPLEITSNYLEFHPLIGDQSQLNIAYIIKQHLYDLKFIVDINAYIPFTRKGTIIINGDRRIKRGMIIRYKPTGETFYIDSVNQNYQSSSSTIDRTTTLQVSRGMVEKYLSLYFHIIDTPIKNSLFFDSNKNYYDWVRILYENWKVNPKIFNFFLLKKQFSDSPAPDISIFGGDFIDVYNNTESNLV